MCMIDDSDGPVEILAQQWRTARKQHKCDECYRVIEAGERYYSTRYVYDGVITNHKCCAHCDVVRQWLADECGGWLYHGVEEDIREHVAHGDYPLSVARLSIGMQWKWRARSGRMLSIPKLPMTTHERFAKAEGA